MKHRDTTQTADRLRRLKNIFVRWQRQTSRIRTLSEWRPAPSYRNRLLLEVAAEQAKESG